MPVSSSSFTDQTEFVEFAESALASYDSKKTTPSEWARFQARAFYHSSNSRVSVRDSYSAFLAIANNSVKVTDSRALKRDSQLVAAITPEVYGNSDEGRKQLNSFLFSEYEKWWDAFSYEAAEDMDDSSTAEDRFSYHCASILRRKTGLKRDVLAAVVGAWLLSHHA
jgi:hypothetical protein